MEKLYKYLEEDEKIEGSKNDFGGDVLPRMLSLGEKMIKEINGKEIINKDNFEKVKEEIRKNRIDWLKENIKEN